jgi:16S rRNA (cytidine1402-2'-O)-methyltransferase
MAGRKDQDCGPIDTAAAGAASPAGGQRSTLELMATEMLRRQLAEPLAAGLYLVATPIGNLADISLRALGVLARADLVYCEDTRHSLKLLNHYGIRASLRSYHEHNAERERGPLLAEIEAGRSVALISDAGTPLVSDPGYKLVRAARERGLPVSAIPGASAVLAALSIAGLPSDQFHFTGFLPAKGAARRTRLQELAAIGATLVLFESPRRLAAALADMASVLGARPAAVTRELTKLHETLHAGSLAELAARFAHEEARGEVVVLVAPGETAGEEASDEAIIAALAAELATSSRRDAVRAVAARLGLPRARVYDLSLSIDGEGD